MKKYTIINEAKHSHGADLSIKAKANELRKKMTVPEKILWEKLRKKQLNGFYFRRQHPYGIYILDFFCCKANLVIELDGAIHKYQEVYDKERTKYLESSGLKILRFNNEEIIECVDSVINVINERLNI